MLDERIFFQTSGVMFFMTMPLFMGFLLVPYFILRWRVEKRGQRDPHLGLKFGLHSLLTVSVLILVTGLSVVVADFLSHIADKRGNALAPQSGAMKTGFALILAGLILSPVHAYMLYTKTNDMWMPWALRMFRGGRMIIAGLVTTMSLTVMLVAILQESPSQAVMPMLGVTLVWGTFWLICAWLVMTTRPDPEPAAQPPQYQPTPPGSPPAGL